ncbi:MAG: hypothetical protein M1816_004484 [Peltula sp. TS41687]|nr:MAG: hypothetical protein M1816_004484 [Peltula sp. TS41687]
MSQRVVPFPTISATSVLGSILLVQYGSSSGDGGRSSEHLISSRTISPSYIWTALQLFLVQFVAWAIWKVVLYPHYFSPLRNLPEPKDNTWFMGQWPRIQREAAGAPLEEWINAIPNDGLIRYRGIFNADRLLLTSPRAMGEVMTQKSYDFVKPGMLRGPLMRILGVGMLLAEGDEHKTQRKNFMPAFAFRHVKDLYPIFWSKSQELVEAIAREANKAREHSGEDVVIEIGEWASRATLDIIGVAGMGKDFNAIQDPNTDLSRVYRVVFKPTKGAQILAVLSLFLPRWIMHRLPVKENARIGDAAEVIRKTCLQLIRHKVKMLEKDQDSAVDILSVAIKSGAFSESNLVDQLMTFMVAGHETTATGVLWAVYQLCRNPDVQRRLRSEIRTNIPSIDAEANESKSDIVANIERCSYLHAFCNEVLRLNPPVPVTMRQAAHDTTILDQHVPSGTLILIPPWAVNRSIALWGPDAKEFKPERWIGPGRANTGGADSNYSFLTFLHGPRSCIGQAFAKAEFACLVAALVGRFEMNLVGEEPSLVRPSRSITSKPEEGLHVRVRVVDGW